MRGSSAADTRSMRPSRSLSTSVFPLRAVSWGNGLVRGFSRRDNARFPVTGCASMVGMAIGLDAAQRLDRGVTADAARLSGDTLLLQS